MPSLLQCFSHVYSISPLVTGRKTLSFQSSDIPVTNQAHLLNMKNVIHLVYPFV